MTMRLLATLPVVLIGLSLSASPAASRTSAEDDPRPLMPGPQARGSGISSTTVLALGSAAALQVLLVGGLLVERRRRRRAERAVAQQRQDARTQLAMITHLDRRAALGEVTAAIAHELNQPLEAILHNAEAGEMLLESDLPSRDDVRQILADIRRIDMRAAEIIQRLRGLLRRHEFETGSVDINDLARETASMVASVAGSKGVRIDLDTTPDPPTIAGDRIHLQQVLLNLLLNGIEAMCATPYGCRVLVIRTRHADRHIEVSVTDRGPGIPTESVGRIFEPFYTTKSDGMGIGLSIGRTIVEAHGGCIAAQNNIDGGATVWFTLPSDEAAALPERPRRALAGRRASFAAAAGDGRPRLVRDQRAGGYPPVSARTT